MDFASITALAYLPIGGGAHLDITDNSLRQAGLAQSGKNNNSQQTYIVENTRNFHELTACIGILLLITVSGKISVDFIPVACDWLPRGYNLHVQMAAPRAGTICMQLAEN